MLWACGVTVPYSDRMESFDSLPLSSPLAGGSRNRLRFSGTELAPRPTGMDPEGGWSGTETARECSVLAPAGAFRFGCVLIEVFGTLTDRSRYRKHTFYSAVFVTKSVSVATIPPFTV